MSQVGKEMSQVGIEGEIIPTKFPMRLGRPPEYKPEMAYTALSYRMEGKSKTQVMAVLGIVKDTYYRYCREYPDFREADELGEIYAQATWEKIAQDVATGKIKGSAAMIEFMMKSRFPKEYQHRSESLHINIDATSSLTKEQLDDEIKRLRHLEPTLNIVDSTSEEVK